MNKAFIFPGQGSQNIGMGKDFYDAFPIAKETFQEVDEILKLKLSDIIFNGPEDTLTSTINTQPALMVTSIAILNTLLQQSGKKIDQLCSVVAGHSLGEYSALCAAESITLGDSAKLLQIRGHSMQEACPVGVGAMAACIGVNIIKLESIIKSAINSGICQIANDNIEGQIVISGHDENIERVIAILKDLGYRAIKLKVSAPFHCELMRPAEAQMTQAFNEYKINNPVVPIITNISAEQTTNASKVKVDLISQVCGRVRWRETLDKFSQLEITEIVEIGAGKVLTNMAKKTDYNFKTFNISTVNEMEEYIKIL